MHTRIGLFVSAIVLSFVSSLAIATEVKPRIMDPINAPVSQFPYAAKLVFTLANTKPGFINIGSGVLIAPNIVLTAGHCAYDPASKSGITSMNVTLNGVDYSISKYYVHPSWNGQTSTEGVIDAAILVLSTPSPVLPMAIWRGPMKAGDLLTLVGFGQIGTGFTGQIEGSSPPLGTVNYGSATVESVETNYLHWTYHLGQQTTAHGDSGGPGLVTVPQLIGNTLKLATLCESGEDPTLYGQKTNELIVSSFSDWIDSIVGFTSISTSPTAQHPLVMYSGESIAITIGLANDSLNDSGLFEDRFRLSKNGIYNESDPLLIEGVVANLAHHSRQDENFIGNVPFGITGAFALTSRIDPDRALFESDTTDNYYVDTIPVVILNEDSEISAKKKLGLNFKTVYKDSLDVTFELPSDLQFSSNTELATATTGKKLAVYIGGTLIESIFLIKGKGSGAFGKITWNYRKGELRYTTTKANLQKALAPYGAVNAFVTKTLPIPVWFEFNGVFYGAQANFLYIGIKDKNGKGF